MRVAALATIATLLPLAGPAAAEGDIPAFVRTLESQPGVAVAQGDAGGVPYTEWRKAGVFYRLEKRKDGDVLYGDDESGAGAVMCTWGIYGLVRDALEDCPSGRFSDLRADLDRDILAIERFIVANSVLPTTATEIRAQAAAQRARTRATAAGPRICASGDVGGMVSYLDGMGAEGRRAAIDKVLAVPRWPVLNPCL